MPCNNTYTVLHTEASMGWGGQEMRILRESIGLIHRGWQVILACDPESGLFLHAMKHNIPVVPIHFSYGRSLSVLKKLRETMRECDVDIVHTHSSIDSWLGGIAARLYGATIVRTRHLSTPIKGGLNAKILYGKLTDGLICTSQKALEELLPFVPATRAIECIATGVDEAELEPLLRESQTARDQLGLNPSDIAVGTACILRSWKGIEEFLAAADAFKGFPQVKFFVFGGGAGLDHYQQLAKTDYPNAQITFTGHLDPVSRALSALDIFCLLSTANEGISQATLQAAYLKKPLITTAVGGLPEVCLDQQTGLLVPAKNPQAVLEALDKLLQNVSLREEMGEAGHKLVLSRFTMNQSLDAIERVLRASVASRKA